MSGAAPIGVGVIGLGFMGRTHVAACESARRAGFPCRLVAVCDRRRAAGADSEVAGSYDTGADAIGPALRSARRCANADDLLADERVQLVSVCTYTDSHVELARRALRAGKHVLVEKPLALRSVEIEPLAEEARAARTLCMPAMCLRFWPAWEWLKERIDDGAFGAVRSAVFQRLAPAPAWGREFYGDESRCGGALLDLHVHDADFLRWCFGDPDALRSTGTADHLTTLYRYRGGPPHVVAEGGWDHAPGFAFRMRYVVVFERATADYDFTRDPALVLCRGGVVEPVRLPAWTGYDGEMRHLLDAIARGTRDLRVTVDDALAVARLLEWERDALEA